MPTTAQQEPASAERDEPALPHHLAATVAISILAGLIAVGDALHLALPCPLGHAAVMAVFAPWVFYRQTRGYRLLLQRMEAVAWADGFVHGVSRRTPPDERVRWME